MKKSFKSASIWSVLWRFLLFSIIFGVMLGVLVGLLYPLINAPEATSLALNLLIYGVLFFVVKKRVERQNFSWDAFTGKNTVETKPLIKIALITLLVVVAATTFSYFLFLLINLFDSLAQLLQPFFELILSLDTNISKLSLFITAVVAAPIAEETFFRGYLLNKWAEKYKATSAIFWSSFLFMIIHIPSLFLPQFLIGLLCAIVYMKTKKLIYPILAHAFYNFIVSVPALFSTQPQETTPVGEQIDALFNPSAQAMQSYIIGSIIFIISLIVLFFLLKRYGNNMNQELTPYVSNIDKAPDFFDYESNREPTEEETLENWEENNLKDE